MEIRVEGKGSGVREYRHNPTGSRSVATTPASRRHTICDLHCFGYDTVKIVLLLVGIIFVVTVARSFLSLERTRALLGGRREGVANDAAAGLGVATPFCSCSAVLAFIGFVAAGVPLGVTLSFLIASPLINELAVVLLREHGAAIPAAV